MYNSQTVTAQRIDVDVDVDVMPLTKQTSYKKSDSSFRPREKTGLLHANNKCTDQSAHQRRLISAFVIRCMGSILHFVAKPATCKSAISSLCM